MKVSVTSNRWRSGDIKSGVGWFRPQLPTSARLELPLLSSPAAIGISRPTLIHYQLSISP
jgi:hypothetical protein